jgi:ribosomal protein S18 acetylase RimI-like enzyme
MIDFDRVFTPRESLSTLKFLSPVSMHDIEIVIADLNDAQHQQAVVAMTAAYALDPMGNGGPLTQDVLDRLIEGLRNHPTTIVFLAYLGNRAVGIATCFRGFSTFYARPLINIHDLAILSDFRGRGIGRKLLEAVESYARELNCCKVTLETQENNSRARALYENVGFSQATYDPTAGGALFYAKIL